MDLFQYREKHGEEGIQKLASAADTQVSYLDHLVFYRKRPSADLAHRLIKASGNSLKLEMLLLSTEDMKRKRLELRARITEKQHKEAVKALAKTKPAPKKPSRHAAAAKKN